MAAKVAHTPLSEHESKQVDYLCHLTREHRQRLLEEPGTVRWPEIVKAACEKFDADADAE